MASSTKSLSFKVSRQNPELIPPTKPTPHEFKPLSDIDDKEGLRFQIPVIQFYRDTPSMEGKDPVGVIRAAVAEALVSYYPFTGRLRESAARKLVVECTGEGVLFIEADADVTLRQFGDNLQPPFPCLEELLYDVPGSGGVTGCPLMLIQVYKDTFTHQICSSHPQIVTPCDCGEPLNKELNHMLEEPPFDPLGIQSRLKGAAVGIGVILLSLALAESVSTSGILLNI